MGVVTDFAYGNSLMGHTPRLAPMPNS